jgi:hypothetical protein
MARSSDLGRVSRISSAAGRCSINRWACPRASRTCTDKLDIVLLGAGVDSMRWLVCSGFRFAAARERREHQHSKPKPRETPRVCRGLIMAWPSSHRRRTAAKPIREKCRMRLITRRNIHCLVAGLVVAWVSGCGGSDESPGGPTDGGVGSSGHPARAAPAPPGEQTARAAPAPPGEQTARAAPAQAAPAQAAPAQAAPARAAPARRHSRR